MRFPRGPWPLGPYVVLKGDDWFSVAVALGSRARGGSLLGYSPRRRMLVMLGLLPLMLPEAAVRVYEIPGVGGSCVWQSSHST